MEPGGQTVLAGDTAGPLPNIRRPHCGGAETARTGHKLVPFGVFVQVADGIEGLVHLRELTSTPVETPSDVVQAGDEVTVVVTEIDRERRRLVLSRRQSSSDHR
ncbi:S1 RNA-binding domain-containing protein [Streptomyces sp. NPDC050534]|uniref:S1 RNA-binding domain-containing protein n=1 Tax=Streptomyces sp. NPDC050534 TaxID=3365625 RepID=UPI0037AEE81B